MILDGPAGLEIGGFFSISAGLKIYTHSTVNWSNSMGKVPIEKAPSKNGNGVYIGLNSIIQMGFKVEDKSVIGAISFLNKNVKRNQRVFGCLARPLGN